MDGQGAVRRHRGHAEAGCDIEADAVGQAHGTVCWEDGELLSRSRRAPVRCEVHPHAVADSQARDAVADRVDDACTVLVRDHLRECQGAARTGLPVGRVHTGHDDAHPHLTRARDADLAVDERQDGGVTGTGEHDCFHVQVQGAGAVSYSVGRTHEGVGSRTSPLS